MLYYMIYVIVTTSINNKVGVQNSIHDRPDILKA